MNTNKSELEYSKEELEIAYADDDKPIGFYGYGWAFYKSCGTAFKDELYNASNDDLKNWCLGFLAAMTEYPEFRSFKRALLGLNVDCTEVEKLCTLAEKAISESTEFIRLPPVPIRDK